MRSIKLLSVLTLATLFCVGCGHGKPDGIPKLSQTKVTVQKAGAPVVEANVFLVPDGAPSGSWSVSGKTDAMGVATIKTMQGDWEAPGAPEGNYKIYLTKFTKIEEPPMPENMDEDEEAKNAYYAEREKRLKEAGNEIPKAMNDAGTSGLTISVGSGLTELTIDVDQAPEK